LRSSQFTDFMRSIVLGVAHAASCATVLSIFCFVPSMGFAAFCFAFSLSQFSGLMSFSFAPGVGHEEEAHPFVRRTEIAGSQTVRPSFVADSLQVVLYKVEPTVPNRLLNLLPEDDARPALCDEVEESRP
jgi:hypothetical protein